MTPFKIGKAAPANTFLAIWMAHEVGFYEAEGLAVEIVPMVGGREAGPTLAAGRIQLMHIGMSSVVRANGAGADLVTVGSLSNVIRCSLFGAPGITTAAQLRGGTIAISSTGSESDATTTLALGRLGLTRQDIHVQEVGVERFSAVRDGAVAAAMLDEPRRSEALKAGLTMIVDFFSERVPWLYSGLVVHRPYLADHRGEITSFHKATIEGNYLALADEKRARDILARELRLTDRSHIERSYANFKSLTPPNVAIDPTGAENIIATVAPPDSGCKAEDYIDTSVLDALRAEGYFNAMEKKYGMR
jgi:ABC-type nitrate/sulfonate/bicarbonate transport system substrate-binding protein